MIGWFWWNSCRKCCSTETYEGHIGVPSVPGSVQAVSRCKFSRQAAPTTWTAIETEASGQTDLDLLLLTLKTGRLPCHVFFVGKDGRWLVLRVGVDHRWTSFLSFPILSHPSEPRKRGKSTWRNFPSHCGRWRLAVALVALVAWVASSGSGLPIICAIYVPYVASSWLDWFKPWWSQFLDSWDGYHLYVHRDFHGDADLWNPMVSRTPEARATGQSVCLGNIKNMRILAQKEGRCGQNAEDFLFWCLDWQMF